MEQLIIESLKSLQPIMVPSAFATGWFALGIIVAKVRDAHVRSH